MTVYRVYYSDNSPHAKDMTSLEEALTFSQQMRKEGFMFVTLVTHDPNCVGQLGVDGVQDGKLPDGTEYSWKKRR